MVRIAGITGVLFLAGFAVFVATRQNLRFDGPLPDIAASTDSSVIEHGRYLARYVANCGACHGAPALMDVLPVADVPLSGGLQWDIPPGVFHAPNITPHDGTGIGAVSDGELARALRYGIGADGRALLPFMEMQGLADDDLAAIISYLRRQDPVEHAVPAHTYTLLGRIVRATALANPIGPVETPPAAAPREVGIERGGYLAGSVANCWACHTERSPNTGELLGPRYSGARSMPGEAGFDTVWAPSNLTRDPKTGVLARMSEDAFVARFQAGPLLPGSPMPWKAYQGMREDDLRSIHRFLMSLDPVENDVGPSVRVAR
jgi:mono/diheme cytochrome c family protein